MKPNIFFLQNVLTNVLYNPLQKNLRSFLQKLFENLLQKRQLRAFIAFSVAFCIISCATDPTSSKTTHQEVQLESDTLVDSELALLRDGDVVLRAGNGMVSEQIIQILHEPLPLSHCGIFYRTAQGDSVISSESRALQEQDGVQTEPLWLFARDAKPHSILVVRPHGTPQQAREVVQRAKYYLQKHIPFDYAFDIRDDHFFYCAELLQHIFIDVYKKDLLDETIGTDKPLLRMRQFYDPQKFDIIVKHRE